MSALRTLDDGPPHAATVMARTQESPTIFPLQLRLDDAAAQAAYRFAPGQFNMLYLYGVGEVPISIMCDPEEHAVIGHAIRALGRVTRGLAALEPGDKVGLRGPFGRGWPLQEVSGCDVVLITGGLGCAPVVSVIHYVLRRRERYGKLVIIQGVKHAEDLIWCGPEGMMRTAAENLLARGLPDSRLYLSLERNVQCAVGRCGHCQLGGAFVCRDGPV